MEKLAITAIVFGAMLFDVGIFFPCSPNCGKDYGIGYPFSSGREFTTQTTGRTIFIKAPEILCGLEGYLNSQILEENAQAGYNRM